MYGFGYTGIIASMKKVGGAAPSFSPTDLSGLKLWVDANDFVSAGVISQWNDKSGLNNHLIQGTGAAQPSVVLNVQNSKPIVRFDGVNDFFDLTTTISGSTDWTGVYVMKAFDASSNMCGLSYNTEVGYPVLQFGSSTYAGTPAGYVSVVNSVTSFCAMTGTRLVEVLGLKKNNVALTTTPTVIARGANDFAVFGKLTSSYPSKGDFAEAVFYNRVLTTQEMIDLNTYLVAKWAL